MKLYVLLSAAVLVAGAASAQKTGKGGTSQQMLGTWQLTRGVVGGASLPDAAVKGIRLELTHGRYVATTAEGSDKGTWQIHPETRPLGLDVKGTEGPNKGKTFPAIVECKGNRLRICYDLSGTRRPTRFESRKKSLLFLAEYKRIKP